MSRITDFAKNYIQPFQAPEGMQNTRCWAALKISSYVLSAGLFPLIALCVSLSAPTVKDAPTPSTATETPPPPPKSKKPTLQEHVAQQINEKITNEACRPIIEQFLADMHWIPQRDGAPNLNIHFPTQREYLAYVTQVLDNWDLTLEGDALRTFLTAIQKQTTSGLGDDVYSFNFHPKTNSLPNLNLTHIPRALIPPYFLEKCCHFAFTDAGISEISEDDINWFHSMRELEVIDLSGNDLQKLPDTFDTLKSVKRLALSSDSLETIPENIFRMTNLETLDLRAMPKLTSLPGTIENASALKNLILPTNFNIQGLPYPHGVTVTKIDH